MATAAGSKSPLRAKSQKSSILLTLNGLKKATEIPNRQLAQPLLSPKSAALTSRNSKVSNSATNGNKPSRRANPSTTAISRPKKPSISSISKQSKKRLPPAKIYDPIHLPEDILTIQAHTVSTPVTELPYLLIAAHIAALPTARQFYPPSTATPTPLTVFRDMFVMTVDVRGYKPKSVRLSTDGQLIIIECLQTEVPQVVFTQTGTVDSDDHYVVDSPPSLSSMPVHTSFSYVQHRVKLPDDFSEEGLKVGMDDVSGHVIITGRLVHDQKYTFPEPWNKNRIVKKIKGPLVNTSCSSLSREDARKLAAFHAVQGTESSEKSHDVALSGLLVYGKKQWLEREGAKLRAIQHKALKENIRRLTEAKKGSNKKTRKKDDGHVQSGELEVKHNDGSDNKIMSMDQHILEEHVNIATNDKNDPSNSTGGGTAEYLDPSTTAGQNEHTTKNIVTSIVSENKSGSLQNLSSSDGVELIQIERNDSDPNISHQFSIILEKQDSQIDCCSGNDIPVERPPAIFEDTGTEASKNSNADTEASTNDNTCTEASTNDNTCTEASTNDNTCTEASTNDNTCTEASTNFNNGPEESHSMQCSPLTGELEETSESMELIEKQDKLMWEKILIYAGVKGKLKNTANKSTE